ncbi:MAG: LEA type 2 family protein [Pseudomonadales bacterium]
MRAPTYRRRFPGAWLWRMLAAVALLGGLGGCASQPSVDVNLVGLAPMESTLLEQRLRLDFRLQNFGDRALEATGMEMTLNVNGQRLARGVDNGAFRVDRLSETRVSAVVSTSLFDVARQLLDLPNRESFSYELTGRVYLQGWPRSMPFRRGGEISRADLARLVGSGGRAPAPLRLE